MYSFKKAFYFEPIKLAVALLSASLPHAGSGTDLSFPVELSEGGRPHYKIFLQDQPVLDKSALGLVLSDRDLSSGFDRVERSEPVTIDIDYTLLHGKQSQVSREAEEVVYRFYRDAQVALTLRARLFEDGVAYRYEIDDLGVEPVRLLEEVTSIVPAAGLESTILQPMDRPGNFTPAYENHMYMKQVKEAEFGYCFPMLFENSERPLFMLAGETDLTAEHSAARLRNQPGGSFVIGLPDPGENPVDDPAGPTFTRAWSSAWRIFIIGEDLGTIVESTMPTDLAAPSTLEDASWIRPGYASWSWWSDGSSPKDTEKVKHFIDLAAEMDWEYSLVDANWSRDAVPELVAYAQEKGVELFYWYNSGGDHNTVGEQPRDLMVDREIRRKEMAWLRDAGIVGIKVDFFNSDKQARIQQYIGIMEDAADFELMLNFHGCTLPRGWERTYPHMMTMEAVRGGESYKFAGDWWNKLAPMHNVNVALTRNVLGPVDYTPGIVSRETRKFKTLTTAAHELALGVVLQSGITHWCDSVEAYRALTPEVQNVLRELPRTWDETRFIQGAPRDFVVLARRSGDRWWLAGISGSDAPMELDLPWGEFFTDDAAITVIGDAEGGESIGAAQSRTVRLEPYGGFVAWESN